MSYRSRVNLTKFEESGGSPGRGSPPNPYRPPPCHRRPPMPAPNNTSVAEQQDDNPAAKRKPDIDAAKLIHAKGSSPRRFKELVERYRRLGASDTDIVRAMVSSPLMINSLGRRR